jgi:hypothetical protein
MLIFCCNSELWASLRSFAAFNGFNWLNLEILRENGFNETLIAGVASFLSKGFESEEVLSLIDS